MQLHYCSDYEAMSQKAAEFLTSELHERSDRLICTATGNSPLGLYEHLVSFKEALPDYSKSLRFIKLDEWGGIPMTDPNSCEVFVRDKILMPLEIPKERYLGFTSDCEEPEVECRRIQSELEQKGPIDICILGLGKNGHIGFNEPADFLLPHCHVAQLSEPSKKHQMVDRLSTKPDYGLTLGMADILSSKKIILLITGKGKKEVVNRLMTQEVSSQLPASFLWLHPHVHCYVDNSSM
ncbi:galactosamine-6-phosphate isomerase [Maribacter halichondriae]|uniref:galactosamine-6-phosphate isomerase n=1 Tax=Maribacter halichondriae TaxID=2980554 RepID=UPI0023585B00|nr:galactosamine-6-phosphate isomerase [Maribacter sp. Hal144]